MINLSVFEKGAKQKWTAHYASVGLRFISPLRKEHEGKKSIESAMTTRRWLRRRREGGPSSVVKK
jgi:hypothetical protein